MVMACNERKRREKTGKESNSGLSTCLVMELAVKEINLIFTFVLSLLTE